MSALGHRRLNPHPLYSILYPATRPLAQLPLCSQFYHSNLNLIFNSGLCYHFNIWGSLHLIPRALFPFCPWRSGSWFNGEVLLLVLLLNRGHARILLPGDHFSCGTCCPEEGVRFSLCSFNPLGTFLMTLSNRHLELTGILGLLLTNHPFPPSIHGNFGEPLQSNEMQPMNLLLRLPHLAVPRNKAKERSNPTRSSPHCQQNSKNKR